MTLSDRLHRVMDKGGDVPAIIFNGIEYPWSRVRFFAEKLSEALAGADPDGNMAALVLRNRPVAAATLVAVLAAHRCAAPISGIQPSLSLCNNVRSLNPSLLIAERADWNSELEDAVRSGGGAGLEIFESEGSFQVQPRLGLERAASQHPSAVANTTGLLMSTSGTTGPPTRVPLNWDHLENEYSYDERPIVRQQGLIMVIPIVTAGGLKAVLTCAAKPQPLVLMERLDVRKWADLVAEHKPRSAGLPPAGLRMLLEADIPAEKFASLESWYTGSAPMSPDAIEALEDRYGKPVLLSYGATELGQVARWTTEMHREYGRLKRGSSGRAPPGVEIRVIDEISGDMLPPGESGVFEIHSPSAPVQGSGYWTRTSDVGRIDTDGFVFVEGRADDVIIRGGLKVPLFDLEAVIKQHPAVDGCAAAGLPDVRLGQVPGVLVVLKEGFAGRVSEAQLTAWIHDRVPPYHVPVKVRYVDAIPLNAMLKVSRPEVKAALGD